MLNMLINLQPELAITLEDEKNLSEVYAFLSQPGIALPDPNKHDANERYDPSTLLDLALRWPEAQRFPRQSSSLFPVPVPN